MSVPLILFKLGLVEPPGEPVYGVVSSPPVSTTLNFILPPTLASKSFLNIKSLGFI